MDAERLCILIANAIEVIYDFAEIEEEYFILYLKEQLGITDNELTVLDNYTVIDLID